MEKPAVRGYIVVRTVEDSEDEFKVFVGIVPELQDDKALAYQFIASGEQVIPLREKGEDEDVTGYNMMVQETADKIGNLVKTNDAAEKEIETLIDEAARMLHLYR